MNIMNGHNETFNYPDWMEPLFNAMKEGRTIKRVIYFSGDMNKDNPEKDITLEDFIATDYLVGISRNLKNGTLSDNVITNKHINKDSPEGRFYMHWIKSFEI